MNHDHVHDRILDDRGVGPRTMAHEAHAERLPFVPEPLIPPEAFAVVTEAIRLAVTTDSARLEAANVLEGITARAERLNGIAAFAADLAAGDREAIAAARAAFESLAEPRQGAVRILSAPPDIQPTPLARFDRAPRPEPESVNMPTAVDLFLAASLVTFGDLRRRAKYVEVLRRTLDDDVRTMTGLLDAAKGFLRGRDPASFLLTLDLLGKRKIPGRLPSEYELCLGELQSALSPTGPLTTAHEQLVSSVDDNTKRIASIDPTMTCAPSSVILRSDPADPFTAQRPSGVDVFLGRWMGKITSWSPAEIHVDVPEPCTGGFAFLGTPAPPPPLNEAPLLDAVLAACPFFGGHPHERPLIAIHQSGPSEILQELASIALNYVQPGNRFVQRHRPDITRFGAHDGQQQAISSSNPLRKCASATIVWQVRSDDPNLTVEIREGASVLYAALPASGSRTHATTVDETLTMIATNGCGTETDTLFIPVRGRLTVAPQLVHEVFGTTAQVQAMIALDCATPAALTLQTTSSTPAAASVPASVTIPAGQQQASLPITIHAVGGPNQPATRITIQASGYETRTVDVWVEPAGGLWVAAPNSDMVPVHMALLPTGKVLFFSGDENDANNVDRVKARLWDPATRTKMKDVDPAPPRNNLFCAGQAFLPDGRLLVVGGHAFTGIGQGADHEVHVFNPWTEAWTRLAPMNDARWYPTCVTLPDGRVLIVSGSSGGGGGSPFFKINEDYQVFTSGSGMSTPLKFLTASNEKMDLYPVMVVLPGRWLFVYTRDWAWLYFPSVGAHPPLDLARQLFPYPTVSQNRRTYPGQSAAVLLPLRRGDAKARILVAGGPNENATTVSPQTPATRTTEIFEFLMGMPPLGLALHPGWRSSASLTDRRFMSDGVLLPDGTVLVLHGADTGQADNNSGPVLTVQRFDPATETWSTMASATVPRRYHSSALLLPDGTVLSAGSTGGWFDPLDTSRYIVEKRIEIFFPPYLFRGPRPRIVHAPSRIYYRAASTPNTFEISTPDASAVARVAIVRLGSVTHSVNTDQRYVDLPITSRADESVRAELPQDGSWAPPGYYMLFVVDERGVPSAGRMIRVG